MLASPRDTLQGTLLSEKPAMDRTLIDRFEQGGQRLRDACTGLNAQELTARPGPGRWSIHELVIHLADTDAIAIDRMKRVLTEDNPMLLNADESAYITELHPHEQSLDDALTLFEINRRQWARVLRLLPDEAFARPGTHNLSGHLTLGDLLKAYSDHLDHHLQFLFEKRKAMGLGIGG